MCHHGLDVVLAVRLCPFDTLLVVVRPAAAVLLAYDTVRGLVLSEERVSSICIAILVQIEVVDVDELEAVRQANLSSTCTVEHMTFSVVGVQAVGALRVRLVKPWTIKTDDRTVTIVVEFHARLVVPNLVAIGIVDIHRIDRSHVDHSEHVACRSGVTFTVGVGVQVVAVEMTVCHVTFKFQPVLDLVVGLQT